MSALAPRTERLDDVVLGALADPGWIARHDGGIDTALVERARMLAASAFADDEAEPDGADEVFRTMYVLHAQNAWSPVDAPRANQHDLTLTAVLLELERAFERWLARWELPEDPPREADAFCAWLQDLALEREVLPPSGAGKLIRERATLDQMREIVAQRSLFFLKEPDPWAMVIPSLHGVAKAGLLDVLLDEYGWGRHDHMHSTVYETLMRKLDLDTAYDAYLDRTAWQYLAGLDYQGMLARHRRLCRRMYGYIYLVEADSPRSMVNYLGAWERLGIDDPDVRRFYELHVTADEGHQQVALEEVIAPVVRAEPAAAPEIARGVLEGHVVHALFSRHLVETFSAGRSSLAGRP